MGASGSSAAEAPADAPAADALPLYPTVAPIVLHEGAAHITGADSGPADASEAQAAATAERRASIVPSDWARVRKTGVERQLQRFFHWVADEHPVYEDGPPADEPIERIRRCCARARHRLASEVIYEGDLDLEQESGTWRTLHLTLQGNGVLASTEIGHDRTLVDENTVRASTIERATRGPTGTWPAIRLTLKRADPRTNLGVSLRLSLPEGAAPEGPHAEKAALQRWVAALEQCNAVNKYGTFDLAARQAAAYGDEPGMFERMWRGAKDSVKDAAYAEAEKHVQGFIKESFATPYMPHSIRQRSIAFGEESASNLSFLLKEYVDHAAKTRRSLHWPPPPPLFGQFGVGIYQFVRTRFMYVVAPADANVWKLLSAEPPAATARAAAAATPPGTPRASGSPLTNSARLEQVAAFEAHSNCVTSCDSLRDLLIRAFVALALSASIVACVLATAVFYSDVSAQVMAILGGAIGAACFVFFAVFNPRYPWAWFIYTARLSPALSVPVFVVQWLWQDHSDEHTLITFILQFRGSRRPPQPHHAATAALTPLSCHRLALLRHWASTALRPRLSIIRLPHRTRRHWRRHGVHGPGPRARNDSYVLATLLPRLCTARPRVARLHASAPVARRRRGDSRARHAASRRRGRRAQWVDRSGEARGRRVRGPNRTTREPPAWR